MTDDADDLFAPRPAPVRVKTRKTPPSHATCVIRETGPDICATPIANRDATIHHSAPTIHDSDAIVSFGCRCGARDEVKSPCPVALDCWNCRGLETMRAYSPRFTPPHTAGRPLTDIEREGMRLDSR